jgi:putative ABC transport system permease protein
MFSGNVKMAVQALQNAKWRSLLTMLGIIIGVLSVVTTVSLGEGVKKQVSTQINQLGNDLITILPGQTFNRNDRGDITGINVFSTLGSSTLTEQDLKSVQKTPNIKSAVPMTLINGIVQVEDKTLKNSFIVGTTDALPTILNQKIEYGDFYGPDDLNKNFVVIGKRVAEQLFGEPNPVARSIKVRGNEFVVRGVFQNFESSPVNLGIDFNSAVFIPYGTGKAISGTTSQQVSRIEARLNDGSQQKATTLELRKTLEANHGGQEDFSVLQQSDNLAVANSVLTILTAFIAGVAAISLIVGGIGIMNIMLMGVSERTKEIGIRKAIGATNRQILSQFMTEAMVLSIAGGLIGILLSLAGNILMRIFSTSLRPVITIPVMLIASGVSVIVGVVFGITPALKAARKDPIIALRHE